MWSNFKVRCMDKNNKIQIILILAVLVLLISGWATYEWFGHELIRLVYAGKLPGILSGLVSMQGRGGHSLEHYINKGDWIVTEAMTLASALFIFLVLFILYLKHAAGRNLKPAPVEWFYLLGGMALIQWYFWWMDDAFIFFRYIDNFLFLDIGLVYNQGEYVEGFSSPLWTLGLALFRLTGASYWVVIRLVSIVSFVVFWLMLIQLNRRLSPDADAINFPLAYLAFNYGVLTYFSSGMETTFLQIIAVAYALYIINPESLILQIMVALSPLLRPELLIPFGLCSLWTWLYYKTFPFRMVLIGIVSGGAWLIFRIYYYADLFPNTYYLKNMSDIKQGLYYLADTMNTYHFYVVAAVLALIVVLLKRKDVSLNISQRLMMIVTALPVILYVIKIGGDFAHYRYLAFPFILIVCASAGILEHLIKNFNLSSHAVLIPISGISISLIVFSFYPPQLQRHPFFINSKNATATQVNKIYDAAQGNKRTKVYPSYLDWGGRINIDIMRRYRSENIEFRYVDTIEPAGCRLSYVRFNKRVIHKLGLTEPLLARTDMKTDLAPAHKLGLRPLGDDIIKIYRTSDFVGRGMYRKAVEDGRAPDWIKTNLASIEIIEKKMFNRHDFIENLKLAFTFPPKITP